MTLPSQSRQENPVSAQKATPKPPKTSPNNPKDSTKNENWLISLAKYPFRYIFKYITQGNVIFPQNSKKQINPIKLLASILKPNKCDYIISSTLFLSTIIHFVLYHIKIIPVLKIPNDIPIEILRIFITLTTFIYILRVAYSAYQNRVHIVDSFKANPLQFFTFIIACGGTLALFVPSAMNIFKLIGDSTALTTAMLGITGGIIAVFGLIKSHQKSELEREQLEVQKQKDSREHIRQLHNSYSDRFDKAIAELHSDDVKATYAAVPKLAKLADAWLDYKDLSDDKKELKKLKKKAKKEAQTIINILSKYIRTMPKNYTEGDFENIDSFLKGTQGPLTEEVEIRRLIFSEISDRSSKVIVENGETSITPGVWSEFNFDFTRAPIFYPLNHLIIEKGVFTSARFYNNADFRGTTFIRDAAFKGVQFSQEANFNGATFYEAVDFSAQSNTKTIFKGDATFEDTHFTQQVTFNEVTFDKVANFSTTTFGLGAQFKNVIFTENEPFFTVGVFKAKFSAAVDPSNYDFSVATNSHDIKRGTAELLNKSFEIPLGTILFDPASGDKSAPAVQRKGSRKRRKPSSK